MITVDAEDYGYGPDQTPEENHDALHRAIDELRAHGGGTIYVVPWLLMTAPLSLPSDVSITITRRSTTTLSWEEERDHGSAG